MRAARRGAAQWALLLGVLAVLVAGGTLVGTCALLLTAGRERAVEAAAERADGVEGSGSADLVTLTVVFADDTSSTTATEPAPAGAEAAELLDRAVALGTQALAPFPVTTSAWVATTHFYLPGDDVRQAYLLDADTAEQGATLVAGRWPAVAADAAGAGAGADALGSRERPVEVAVLDVVARDLGLDVGDRLWLGDTPEHDGVPAARGLAVEVVGVVDPTGSRWSRDPLRGNGSYVGGWVPEYGPLLVAPGTFAGVATGAGVEADAGSDAAEGSRADPAPLALPVARASLQLDPALSGHPTALPQVADAVRGLERAVTSELATHADVVLVRSALPGLVADMGAAQRLTATSVLTVALLAVLLAATASGLVARLVVARRADEVALLSERGAGRWQLARADAGEGLVLAVLATALAVPLALAAYAGLVRSPWLADAWAVRVGPGSGVVPGSGSGSGSVGPGGSGAADAGLDGLLARVGLDARGAGVVLAAVGVAILAQVAVAVVTSARAAVPAVGARRRRTVTRGAARSGADLLLLALAALGVAQLAAHRPGTERVDPVLVAAPVLCVAAAAVLALRVLPLAARLLEGRARRATGLAGPIAAWRVARGRASAGVLLLVVAAVTATLGASWGATWWASQQDQADAAVGADAVLPADGRLAQGPALAAVPGVRVAEPVTHRTVALGSHSGGLPLVAWDTTRADDVVRGRLPGGRSWSAATAALTPTTPRDGLVVAGSDVPVEVSGTVDQPLGLSDPLVARAEVRAILEDARGARSTVPVGAVPLDGSTLRTTLRDPDGHALPDGPWTVVGLSVAVSTSSEVALGLDDDVPVHLRVRVPGAEPAGGATPGASADPVAWSSAPLDPWVLTRDPEVTRTGDAVTLEVHASLFSLAYLQAIVVDTFGFTPDEALPVALPTALAAELGLRVGGDVTVAAGTQTLPARVAALVPYVPSAASNAAVLADADAFSRAMLARGVLDPTTDEWWVATDGRPDVAWPAGAPAQVRAELAEDLRAGPLRAAVPAALVLLVVAAVLLAAAGSAAHASSGAREHDRQTVRLRVLGAPRRVLGAGAFAQHALLVTVAVALGAGLGAVLARVLLPLVVTGRDGATAVPPALPLWPWPAEAAVLGALLVACVLAGLPAARSVVRRTAALGPSLREDQ